MVQVDYTVEDGHVELSAIWDGRKDVISYCGYLNRVSLRKKVKDHVRQLEVEV